MNGRWSLALAALVAATLVVALVNSWRTFQLFATHDVVLDYDAGDSRDVPAHIESRLWRGNASADVSTLGARGARVTVAADGADFVEGLVAWRGGLTVYRLDSSHELAPADMTGLSTMTVARKEGAPFKFFSGSPSALLKAAASTEDDTHRLLFDPFAQHTRAAWKKPLLDYATVKVHAEGKSAVVAVTNPAPLEELSNELGDEVVAFVRGNQIILMSPFKAAFDPHHGESGKPALVISRGDDVSAYRRAHREAVLLGAPPLPHLTLAERRPSPPNWPLAIATLVVPLAVALAWLVFLRQFDRSRPEPWWLVLATFALGGASAELAGLLERSLGSATPYLDARVMSLDGRASAFPLDLLVCVLTVGVVEEGAKFLATWTLATHRREFDEPIDGIVYAGAAAIGFAAVENIDYFNAFRFADELVASRSFRGFPVHVLISVIWGYALGKRMIAPKTRLLPYLAGSALLHGFYDTLIVFGVPGGSLVCMFGLTVIFAVLLRRALQWGAKDELGAEEPAAERTLFRVGRGAVCLASLLAMFVLAASIIAVAHSADEVHVRVSLATLLPSAGLLILFGLAAYGFAHAMPLDVVVDRLGVTFAGALHRWERIGSVERRGAGLLGLTVNGREVKVGPGSRITIDALEVEIHVRLARLGRGGAGHE
jgi:RsiW-degrading membrane proteinase PrsW (M82 family)